MDATVGDSKAAPLDLSHHFARSTPSRKESSIKEFYKFFAIPDIGNLAGGLPNASLFPYDTLEASVALPHRFKPTPNLPTESADAAPAISTPEGRDDSSGDAESTRILVPKLSTATDILQKIDVASVLQYGTAQGYPPLTSFLRHFVRENLHPNVPYAGGPDIILTCGNTDGFTKALELLSNEWSEKKDWVRDRDGILVEEFAYMNAIQAAAPRGLQIVPVGMDHVGMRRDGSGGLRDVLSNWDLQKGKRPHLMYTVTIGQNPTSSTLSVQRRRELYQLCQEYDVIIIEDDPYWYLQYPSAIASEHARGNDSPDAVPAALGVQKSSGYEFLDSLIPSYLSVDTDGRVVRLDTFSKTIAPGCRLGWITTQPALIERFLRICETSTQQPSGFVQSMVAQMIMGPKPSSDGGRGGGSDGKGWGVAGWVRWLEGLRGVYERRMQTMCQILEGGKYLVKSSTGPTENTQLPHNSIVDNWNVIDKVKMFDFVWPCGGMFVWVELNLSSHPLYDHFPAAKLSHALWLHLTTKPYLVLVAPGRLFAPTAEVVKERGHRYFRLCFAAVEEEEVTATSHRFVDGCNSFWAMKDRHEMESQIQESVGCNQM